MAELINLKQADKILKGGFAKLNLAGQAFDKGTGGWSKEQAVHLGQIFEALTALYAGVGEIMHNNRDGRGGTK